MTSETLPAIWASHFSSTQKIQTARHHTTPRSVFSTIIQLLGNSMCSLMATMVVKRHFLTRTQTDMTLHVGVTGPYLHCNPTPIAGSNGLVDLQNFTCLYTAPTYPNPWSPSHGQGCSPPCDRVNVTVGKDPAHHVWPGTKAAKSVMSSYFGG